MAKVAFWSMDKASSGNTYSAVAVLTAMGITRKVTSILIQANFNSKKMESSYTPYDELVASGTFDSSNIGISALSRLITSNKLTPDFIQNYAKPVLKNRLDILYGINSKDEELYKETVQNLTYLSRKADELYDLVFLDLPKTNKHDSINNVLMDSDAVICMLNQDIVKLSEFFKNIETNEVLKDKQKIYVIGDYDEKSKYTAYNIASRFKVKEPIYTVPHNMIYIDHCNDGNVVDFFYKNMNADKNDLNGKFIASVNEIVQKVLDVTKVKEN